MGTFTVIFEEERFHTLEVEAHDSAEAERIARSCLDARPDFALVKSRGLVRWAVEARDSTTKDTKR